MSTNTPPLFKVSNHLKLHQACFEGDFESVSSLLDDKNVLDEIDSYDKYGNTPLVLAVHMKRDEIVELLLSKGANADQKSKSGWAPLTEAIASGNDYNISLIYKQLFANEKANLQEKITGFATALKNMDDFYTELKWEFKSWIPFVSRFCPSDNYKIWKKGANLRVDTTLVGFDNMKWLRGQVSILFRGGTGEFWIVDTEHKKYENMLDSINGDEFKDIQNEIQELKLHDLVSAKGHTKNIKFEQATNWLGSLKESKVNGYNCKVYSVDGFVYRVLSRSLKEITSPNGSNDCSFGDDMSLTWNAYYGMKNNGQPVSLLYKNETIQAKEKTFKGSVYLSDKFPRKIGDFLPIFSILAPTHTHFKKLSDFVSLKMPSDGFPLKLEIPVFPTVTGLVQFTHYDDQLVMLDSVFDLPTDYVQSKVRFNGNKQKR